MTVELFGIGTHGKNLALFKKSDKKSIIFIKESFHEKSNPIIEREYQGYKWYYSNILKKENPVNINRKYFYQVSIPQFQGIKFSAEKKFHNYKDHMLMIIRFYKKHWPVNENFAIHGDMALCNFIIGNENFYLIDWEHYHKSHIKNYGFDIINMLFISFYYRLSRVGYPSFQSKQFIKKCFRLLFDDISSDNNIINRPFYNSKKYLINNFSKHSYEGFDIKNKFMLARTPDETLNKLDLFVTQ